MSQITPVHVFTDSSVTGSSSQRKATQEISVHKIKPTVPGSIRRHRGHVTARGLSLGHEGTGCVDPGEEKRTVMTRVYRASAR